jgi:hypothetical protein
MLWLDWWHPNGVLLEKDGLRIVYDSGSRLVAKLSSVIKNKKQNLVLATSKVRGPGLHPEFVT